MRTIKFRGKEYTQDSWVYGACVPTVNGCWIAIPKNEVTFDNYRVKPETVGQFTSLFDKNKKEIYEGDILRINDDERGVIEVRFVRGVFAFLWNGNLDEEMPINAPTHEWAEVVGNIHDNPELLKGGVK